MELITQALSKRQRIQLLLVNFWQSFSSVEKLYLVAFVLLFLSPNSSFPSAAITVIALTKEFWPRFTKLWDGLAGKAIILFFYAIVTNIALAYSAGIVNAIAGVSAAHLSYAHNIALLLIIPPLFIGVSFLALLAFQLCYPFYLFALICLKPFGVKAVSSLSKSAHPILSHTIRFILCAVLLAQAIDMNDSADQALEELEKQVEQTQPIAQPTSESPQLLATELNNTQQKEQLKQQLTQQFNEQFDEKTGDDKPITFTVKDGDKEATLPLPNVNTIFNISADASYFDLVEQLVANFIYHLEADSLSRCKHPEDSKVIELNDYEVLLINQNPAAKHKLDFAVIKCVSPAFPE